MNNALCAFPTVNVVKQSGSVRICGDFKPLHKFMVVDQHPMPHLSDLFTVLVGGQNLSNLDLSDAYNQLSRLLIGHDATFDQIRQQDEEAEQVVASLETQHVINGPIVYKQLQKYVRKDAVLQEIIRYIQEGCMASKIIECKRQIVFFLQTSTFSYRWMPFEAW